MVQVCEIFQQKKYFLFFPIFFPHFFSPIFSHLFPTKFFFCFHFCSKRILQGDAVYCDQAHSDDFCDCPENCEQPQPGTIVVNSNDMKKWVIIFVSFIFFYHILNSDVFSSFFFSFLQTIKNENYQKIHQVLPI